MIRLTDGTVGQRYFCFLCNLWGYNNCLVNFEVC